MYETEAIHQSKKYLQHRNIYVGMNTYLLYIYNVDILKQLSYD